MDERGVKGSNLEGVLSTGIWQEQVARFMAFRLNRMGVARGSPLLWISWEPREVCGHAAILNLSGRRGEQMN